MSEEYDTANASLFYVQPTFSMMRNKNIQKNKNFITTLHTAQKMRFSIKDFYSKCDQIRIWSHLLKKSLMENCIFCVMSVLVTLTQIVDHHLNAFDDDCILPPLPSHPRGHSLNIQGNVSGIKKTIRSSKVSLFHQQLLLF